MDDVRTVAEEKINQLLENFLGINDSELSKSQYQQKCKKTSLEFSHEITTGLENNVLAKTTGLADRLSEKTTIIEKK